MSAASHINGPRKAYSLGCETGAVDFNIATEPAIKAREEG